jgi:flagellar basal-body rod protein FlgB
LTERVRRTGKDKEKGIVDGVSDSALVAALRRQMTVAAARTVATGGNIANLDTPGYKTKEVSFEQTLGQKMLPLRATSKGHLGGAAAAEAPVVETPGLAERRDGNNVQLDRELMNMNQAAGDFAAAQTALAAKFRLVRYALNESK